MSRKKQKERKRAAAICQSLDKFLPLRKKPDDPTYTQAVRSPPLANESDEEEVHLLEGEISVAEGEDLGEVSETADIHSVDSNSIDCSVSAEDLEVQSRSTEDSEYASNQAEQLLVDIGEIYCTYPTSESFCERIQTLTSVQKYFLLKHHKRPSVYLFTPVGLPILSVIEGFLS